MPEELGEAQLRRIGLGKTFNGIAAHIKCRFKGFRAGPDPAALGGRPGNVLLAFGLE